MRIALLALLLAGCASPGLMTPEQLQALASDKSTVVLCSEVRTLTTTVRTVYLLQSDKGAAGTVAAGAECALALQAK